MTVKERLISYLKYKKISSRQFTIAIGVSESYVSNIRTSIQPDKINSITNHFPDLNTGWLLTGDGEMLKPIENSIPALNSTDSVPISVLQFVMESSKRASAQIDELIQQNRALIKTIQDQSEIIKKTTESKDSDVHQEDDVTCANVSGSDLED